VTLTAPGLDPSWSTTDPRGEALLGPVPPPPAPPPGPDGGHAPPATVAAADPVPRPPDGGSFA
jgi:hypothetical protein